MRDFRKKIRNRYKVNCYPVFVQNFREVKFSPCKMGVDLFVEVGDNDKENRSVEVNSVDNVEFTPTIKLNYKLGKVMSNKN